MPSRLSPLLLAVLALSGMDSPAHGQTTTSVAEVPAKVRELLGRMTLEEKVGQLVQVSSPGHWTGPATGAKLEPMFQSGGVGSMLNVSGADEIRHWQQLALESSRLHIPLLFGLDVIHGYRTIFPIPLASAASWDLPRIEQAERIAATEATSAGITWTFAPMVDIARDPRWGRIAEGAGEDPFLGSAVAWARVRGFQGTDLAASDTLLACAKHFAAYGAAQAGRDYFTTDVPERALREVYLPPFHAAVQAGVATFMAGFNDLNGLPCTCNAFLLDQVLRKEWGFTGVVVSDWDAIGELRAHGVAADLREAAQKAFAAGMDVDMQSGGYAQHLAGLIRSGVVSAAQLDTAVAQVLTEKYRLGLFDDPFRYTDPAREKATLLQPSYLEAAHDLARRSCVLLKNDGVLPLRTQDLTVALVGPLADAPRDQLGTWACTGRPDEAVTIRTALQEVYPGKRLHYARGCELLGDDTSGFAAAVAAAQSADVVVVALGEGAGQSGEAKSRASLDLSGPQSALLRTLHATGKPIVLLLLTGRPLTIEANLPEANAVLLAWHPGTMGGPAVADVLTGAYNPAGHLPVTWPRAVGQIPIFYNHMSSGRPKPLDAGDRYYSHYIDLPNSPLFPFGFGLSYTTFAYDDLRLSAPVMVPDGAPLGVTVRVRNTGQRAGETVVQLYVRDRVGSVTRPVRELKAFQKIDLAPGEARDVRFELQAADLAFWRADLTYGPEPGDFDVYVGSDSNASLSGTFTLAAASDHP